MEIHVQVPTPQEALTITPPPPPTKSSDRHICSYCQASFRRDEHLQRHIRTHTGKKKYQCPCKMTFTRNDVFVRHMRTCQPGFGDEFRCSDGKSRSRTKTKRACDECAKAKAKCDYQVPCGRCHRKSIKCGKTRKGYEDPYAIYSISTPATTPPVTTEVEPEQMTEAEPQPVVDMEPVVDNIINNVVGPVTEAIVSAAEPAIQVSETVCIPASEADFPQELSDEEQNATALMPPSSPQMAHLHNNSDVFMVHTNMPTECDPAWSDCSLALDLDFVSPYFASMGNLDLPLNPQSHYQTIQGYDFFSFQHIRAPSMSNSFSLNRLDPLQAKCDDIIELLKKANSHDTDQTIYACITRQNMVHLCHLYGKHFQQNKSIIHSPTFDMAKSPPTLLLAIMLVGACYSPDIIATSQVGKLARRLLTAIALEPMCERAGLLDAVEPADYSLLTEETFDWDLWIQQETSKRLACEIFCQDMVHCIFLGRTPDFNPRQFHVDLPGYESCWEAETAAECLHGLQNLPQPIRVSTAISMLLSWPDSESPLFEASGFGMFVLINGIHYLLHQAAQVDKETSRYLSEIPDSDTADAIECLKEDPSGPNVTAIADRTLKMHASPVIRRVDNALNTWRTTWDMRSSRDSKYEHCTFNGDPLPFWWLAKLYLLLHHHGHILQPDSEYAIPRAEAPDNAGKVMIQRKVVGWLSSFRGRKFKVDAQTENWLPDLMKLTHESAL